MPSVAIDSGVLYAMFDKADRHHRASAMFMSETTDRLVTTPIVLAEVVYLLEYVPDAQRAFLVFAMESLDVDTELPADLGRIVAIMTKYADLPADFADASLMAMCERRGISKIATFDKHFSVYRTSNGQSLLSVFAGSSGAPA